MVQGGCAVVHAGYAKARTFQQRDQIIRDGRFIVGQQNARANRLGHQLTLRPYRSTGSKAPELPVVSASSALVNAMDPPPPEPVNDQTRDWAQPTPGPPEGRESQR